MRSPYPGWMSEKDAADVRRGPSCGSGRRHRSTPPPPPPSSPPRGSLAPRGEGRRAGGQARASAGPLAPCINNEAHSSVYIRDPPSCVSRPSDRQTSDDMRRGGGGVTLQGSGSLRQLFSSHLRMKEDPPPLIKKQHEIPERSKAKCSW